MREVFLDTAYAIALSSASDSLHRRAVQLSSHLSTSGVLMVTTSAVLLEIGNALSRLRFRQAAIKLLQSLQVDPCVLIVPLSEGLYARAVRLFSEREDKEWGLTDCISFVVMQDRGITEALTSNLHFQQAGFLALLRE